MSISTWKKEFYPTPALRCSKKNALAHSLRRHEGTLKKNLRKHSVTWEDIDALFPDDCEACALCSHYHTGLRNCRPECPLMPRGAIYGCGTASPYKRSFDAKDARPMVRALRKLAKAAKVSP